MTYLTKITVFSTGFPQPFIPFMSHSKEERYQGICKICKKFHAAAPDSSLFDEDEFEADYSPSNSVIKLEIASTIAPQGTPFEITIVDEPEDDEEVIAFPFDVKE